MLNIVLFGPPGAGKGTQSAKLIEQFGLVHLSTGDIFRANIKGETELGKLAKSYIDQGKLVPDEVTIAMLESEVNKSDSPKGFIFDGFPRTQAQAQALDTFLSSKGTTISLMLALEVEEDELKKRLLLRGKDSGRADDQDPAIIQKRIDVYQAETMPVKTYYTQQGKYKGINGLGEIDEIFNALCQAIEEVTGK
ncbi:MAG: adenylate kinase [Bacteroidia bacterium]|nr:adenylate kinase [Bacteroidia bacterium]